VGGGFPTLLMAVRWGGKLAALTAARRPGKIAGLALLAPGLCTLVRANLIQRAALRAADAAGLGGRRIKIPLDDPALFTDVPEYQHYIRDDPLTLRHATARFLRISLDLDEELRRSRGQIRCPTLLMLAGRDGIVDNQATRQFVQTFGTSRKTVIEYPEARHTLEFEAGRERVFSDLAAWLDGITSLLGWHP
jgi:alpha-beta hydrolase superfamily lysophospholipase